MSHYKKICPIVEAVQYQPGSSIPALEHDPKTKEQNWLPTHNGGVSLQAGDWVVTEDVTVMVAVDDADGSGGSHNEPRVVKRTHVVKPDVFANTYEPCDPPPPPVPATEPAPAPEAPKG